MSESKQNQRVLIVDDEPAIRQIFSHFLERRGHHVDICGLPHRALEMLKNQEFDVLVVDLVLPEMSGLDLIEAARKQGSQARVILLTGAPSDESAERAKELSIFRYLSKPIRASALIELVEAAGAHEG